MVNKIQYIKSNKIEVMKIKIVKMVFFSGNGQAF